MNPWRSRLESAIAANAHLPESRFIALATIGIDQYPAVRTLVYRGFFNPEGLIAFCTDLRSEKITELRKNASAQACWYFIETREQFRVSGTIKIISDSEQIPERIAFRESIWRSLSDDARKSFSFPAPGDDLAELAAFSVEPAAPMVPSLNFGLLLVEPESVEILDLRPTPHSRVIHRRIEGQWLARPLNP